MIETWQEFRWGTTTWLAVGQLPLVFRLLSHHACVYLSCGCFLKANVTYSGLHGSLSLTSVTNTSLTYVWQHTPASPSRMHNMARLSSRMFTHGER